MPPMIATPFAAPLDTKQKEDLEFELDIRISAGRTPQPTLNVTNNGTGCCTDSCNTWCGQVSCGGTCATCPQTCAPSCISCDNCTSTAC